MKKSDKDFDQFINQLQEEINQQERCDFSEKVIAEYNQPSNWGEMKDANTQAFIKGPCGDTQMIFLRIENDKIIRASFLTDGCGPTIACGSKLTRMVTNLSLREAKNLTPHDLENALDGLPEDHKHCALLSINTLQKALDSYKQ